MDKYIKQLIIKLSQKYMVILTHKMLWSEDKGRLVNIFTLYIADKRTKERLFKGDMYSKRAVVMELMKYAEDHRQATQENNS